jgi:hypothetical protein
MVKRQNGSRVKRGLYPLLTRKQGQKTVSLRLTDPALVPLSATDSSPAAI